VFEKNELNGKDIFFYGICEQWMANGRREGKV
jgi:hypothetical protein